MTTRLNEEYSCPASYLAVRFYVARLGKYLRLWDLDPKAVH